MNQEMLFMIDTIVCAIICHVIGDYVLQSDYLAVYKKESIYGMFIHCILYIASFYYFFGIHWSLAMLFITHFIFDEMKVHDKFGLLEDQSMHYIILAIYIYLNGQMLC